MDNVVTGYGQGREALCRDRGSILLCRDRELMKVCRDRQFHVVTWLDASVAECVVTARICSLDCARCSCDRSQCCVLFGSLFMDTIHKPCSRVLFKKKVQN